MDVIKVQYKEDVISLPLTNGSLELKVLKRYFPDAASLTYNLNGESRGVKISDDGSIQIVQNIDVYNVYVPKSSQPIEKMKDKKKGKQFFQRFGRIKMIVISS